MTILTKLKKGDFEEILKNYNLGKYKSSRHVWWALQNTVYILNTTKGKFVLKIFERSDPKFINFQVRVMDFVYKKKLPVQQIVKTKSGERLFFYKNKRIMIKKYIEGEEEIGGFNDKLVKNLARNVGLLNKSLLKLKLRGKYNWGRYYQFKPMKERAGLVYGFDFKKNEDKLLKDLKKLKKSKLRRSVVHGDFHASNLLVKNDKLVGIIDWDDVHEDFLVFEIAVFIAHSLITPKTIKKNQIKLFLKEYQRYVKLNGEEEKALYYFIKNRYLAVIAWCVKQLRQHKDRRREIDKWARNIIKRYYMIDKLSLEEFLDFFK